MKVSVFKPVLFGHCPNRSRYFKTIDLKRKELLGFGDVAVEVATSVVAVAGIVGDVENGFAGGPVESFPAQRHSCGAEKECPQAAPQAFDLCRCPT